MYVQTLALSEPGWKLIAVKAPAAVPRCHAYDLRPRSDKPRAQPYGHRMHLDVPGVPSYAPGECSYGLGRLSYAVGIHPLFKKSHPQCRGGLPMCG